jgi:hypothetical protein
VHPNSPPGRARERRAFQRFVGARRWLRTLGVSVVVTQLCEKQRIAFNFVDHAMFLSNAA